MGIETGSEVAPADYEKECGDQTFTKRFGNVK
jgi:hypothetical protein